MTFEKTQIDFDDVLLELLGWIGKWVHVYADYGFEAGGSSFEGHLERVIQPTSSSTDLLLSFEFDFASANLSPNVMTPFKVRNPLTENYWLEFRIGRHRVIEINPVEPQDVLTRNENAAG